MKKLIFLSATAIMFFATTNAQTDVAYVKKDKSALKHEKSVIKKEKKTDREVLRKLKGSEVSEQSMQAFIVDFGNIPVNKWTRGENFDEAHFTKDGQAMKAYYDYNSQLVGTVQDKTLTDLPAKAQVTIKEKYKGYRPESVIFFDDNERNETDMVLFSSQFDDVDGYFVQLQKGNKKIVVQVSMGGDVSYFTSMK
jgi:hypothetical protein